MVSMNTSSNRKANTKFASKYSDGDDALSYNSSNASSNESSSVTNKDASEKKFRTELCKFFEISGSCKFGDNCIFAHGKENLRVKVLNKSGYKKRQCLNFFENGLCLYGNRCQFSHDLKDVHAFSYSSVMKQVTKGKIVNESYEIFKRPRLTVFKKIIQRPRKKKKRTYFDDIIIIQSRKTLEF